MSDRPSARPVDVFVTRRSRRFLGALAVIGMVATTAACNESDTPGDNDRVEAVRLYGSDGNMTSAFGDGFENHADLLNGMRGTTPLNPLPDDIKAKLLALEPKIKDYAFAAEAYDAVVIAALAAETARSTDGPQIARYITAVTVGREGGICESIQTCLDGVRAGRDIKYRGLSMRRSGLTDGGEPSTANYGSMIFDRSRTIDDVKTEYVAAGDERNEAKQPAEPPSGSRTKSGGQLKVGALLPRSGDNDIAGPPEFAGVRLAVNDLNAVGGINGQPVAYYEGDDGTDPEVAGATVDKHIANGVQVIIGASTSGVTKSVMPKIVAAQRVLISPAATSDELSGLPDGGFFFRTAPPDILQSKALTDIIMRYGPTSVVVIARDDSYGINLRDKVAEQLRTAGLKPDRVKVFKYEIRDEYKTADFADIATRTAAAKPDSVLVIGFNESSFMIKAMAERNMKFNVSG